MRVKVARTRDMFERNAEIEDGMLEKIRMSFISQLKLHKDRKSFRYLIEAHSTSDV